ncbi:hypothetical protein [Acidiphilium iwatense]|uniref:Lipoprotein n=1 Tax=Acidiphilium iwatense TaxID=768198 RepID=A0ABS9DW44_9PROT|nr:hypothetical protein [Acidiphilium iwatense]MCF3945896.1 hypothetical protein [Acidiphilium iwatense]
MKHRVILFIPLLLAGCGTLPQPFLGRPGPEGALLSVPPPPVLIVPPPRDALLGDNAARLYATDLAQALVKRDVPSLARPAGKADWRLIAQARIVQSQVVPAFSIVGPTGKIYGHATSAPVAEQAWANGDPAVLKAAAESAAPELATQLSAINASVQQSNPLSLENRPPRVLFAGVSGAPGDGDHALAINLQRDLPQLGIVMVANKHDADFIVNGTVKASPSTHSQERGGVDIVELDWIVRGQSGEFIGKVSQLHDLKPSQMTPYWGDVAMAAAQQAALGLKQVIVNAIPKRIASDSHPATLAKSSMRPEP